MKGSPKINLEFIKPCIEPKKQFFILFATLDFLTNYIRKNYVVFLMLALTNNPQDSIMLTVVNKNIKGEKI